MDAEEEARQDRVAGGVLASLGLVAAMLLELDPEAIGRVCDRASAFANATEPPSHARARALEQIDWVREDTLRYARAGTVENGSDGG